MSNCFIFITGTASGTPAGTINLTGTAQESTENTPIVWTCYVNYTDSINAMQLKIKECVQEHFLTERGLTIGGVGDKLFFVGGVSN